MVLQLNPDVPLVWRSPSSLQFGVESPLVRIDDITGGQEQLVAALVSGATRPGLQLIAESVHASDAEVNELLALLDPLLGRPDPAPTGTVSVIGTTPTAVRLRNSLTEVGLSLVPPEAPAE